MNGDFEPDMTSDYLWGEADHDLQAALGAYDPDRALAAWARQFGKALLDAIEMMRAD